MKLDYLKKEAYIQYTSRKSQVSADGIVSAEITVVALWRTELYKIVGFLCPLGLSQTPVSANLYIMAGVV